MSASNYQRIKRVMNFYYKRGVNKESVNSVYFKIINLKKWKQQKTRTGII